MPRKKSNKASNSLHSEPKLKYLNNVIDTVMSDNAFSYMSIIATLDEDSITQYHIYSNNHLEAITLCDIGSMLLERTIYGASRGEG